MLAYGHGLRITVWVALKQAQEPDDVLQRP